MPPSKKIDHAFEEALNASIFPGAAVAVGTAKKLWMKEVYGLAETLPLKRKLFQKTYFDLASLTKPLSTAFICMRLVDEGKLNLEDPVSKFFSRWKKEPYNVITLKHLLQHTSGLAAYRPYYEDLIPGLLAGKEDLEEIQKSLTAKILVEKLEYNTGELRVYSDLGFMLLGFILEKVTSKTLDKLFAELIAKSLKLNHTFFIRHFSKGKKLPRTDFASTRKCRLRRKVLAGEVDDEHAWVLGGVAGHAGLFSNLEDLIKMADEILKIENGKSNFISPRTWKQFTQSKPALGWDKPELEGSQAGKHFSKQSIGHLGFTGTSIWVDLAKQFYVILLTNRVHPEGKNEAIKEFRPKIHDLLAEGFKLDK
ncbi:MAG: serine hydrolase [Deltaproteobacteria bacterium]|nr:serine hydrolase [Deltaproteobacteria bacterium]